VSNIADLRDDWMDAEAMMDEVIAEVEAEFYKPDLQLQLALMVDLMPEDAWGLVDDDTKYRIMEVL
jgi:hypothetical protein